jgi:hypothetical protein
MNDADHNPTPEELAQAERGRALVAAAVARERAPHALRERIEAQRAAGPPRRARLGVFAPVAAGLAALVAAMVVVLSGGSGPPTVSAVSLIALRGPQLAAPAPRPANASLLQADVDGIAFPEWRELAWPASGVRTDKLEDRSLTTVFYKGRGGAQVGYTIVSGGALDVPEGRHETVNGVRLTVVEDGGRRIVTWQRDRHTCVLSGPSSVPAERMIALAAWDGGGAVPS